MEIPYIWITVEVKTVFFLIVIIANEFLYDNISTIEF